MFTDRRYKNTHINVKSIHPSLCFESTKEHNVRFVIIPKIILLYSVITKHLHESSTHILDCSL